MALLEYYHTCVVITDKLQSLLKCVACCLYQEYTYMIWSRLTMANHRIATSCKPFASQLHFSCRYLSCLARSVVNAIENDEISMHTSHTMPLAFQLKNIKLSYLCGDVTHLCRKSLSHHLEKPMKPRRRYMRRCHAEQR